MEVFDNVGGLFPLVVSKLNLLQELVGHSLQSIIWPGLAEGNRDFIYICGINFVDLVENTVSRV